MGRIFKGQESVFDSWSFRMGPIGCPVMLVRICHYTLRNSSEDRSSLLSSNWPMFEFRNFPAFNLGCDFSFPPQNFLQYFHWEKVQQDSAFSHSHIFSGLVPSFYWTFSNYHWASEWNFLCSCVVLPWPFFKTFRALSHVRCTCLTLPPFTFPRTKAAQSASSVSGNLQGSGYEIKQPEGKCTSKSRRAMVEP